jgi:hypothetical protein
MCVRRQGVTPPESDRSDERHTDWLAVSGGKGGCKESTHQVGGIAHSSAHAGWLGEPVVERLFRLRNSGQSKRHYFIRDNDLLDLRPDRS